MLRLNRLLKKKSILAGFAQNMPIRSQLLIYFIIFSIFPLIVLGVIYYRNASVIIEQQSFQYSKTILRETRDRSEQMLEDLIKASTLLVISSELDSFGFETMDESGHLKYSLEINESLALFKSNRSEVSSIFLCLVSDGEIITPNEVNKADLKHFQDYDVVKNIISNSSITLLAGMHENEFEADRAINPYVMTLSRAVFRYFNTDIRKVLVINISEDTVRKMFNVGIEDVEENLYILDRKGQIVYHKDRNLYGKKTDLEYSNNILQMEKPEGGFFLGNTKNATYVSYIYSPRTEWIYVVELPAGYLLRNSMYIRNMTLVLAVVCIFISFIFTYFAATNFTAPIKKMLESIKQVEAGKLDIKVNIRQQNEFGVLAASYNNMLDVIINLIKKVQEESNKKSQWELDALQAQITPHFLYNTLNSIKCISRTYKDDMIYGMTSSLIDLLRLSISKDSAYITIEEELHLTRSYLYLQSIRYENKFKVLYEVDESLLKCKTLKLLIQPLVENSLLHGLNFTSMNPLIIIRVYTSENDVCFDVEDNGAGMDRDKIKSLMTEKMEGIRGRFSGIGISNVNGRIKMHFGVRYGISFSSEVGIYTLANIRIPYSIDESELM